MVILGGLVFLMSEVPLYLRFGVGISVRALCGARGLRSHTLSRVAVVRVSWYAYYLLS